MKTKKMANEKDIKTLIKILSLKEQNDLAMLLEDCKSYIDGSGQYSTYLSVLSSFIIQAPVEKYYKLKKLSNEDKDLLYHLVLDIYPKKKEYSPEIVNIKFEILQNSGNLTKSSIIQDENVILIFMSYSNEDNSLASKIKSFLESYRFNVFLAHEDINPSEEWEERILQHLDRSNIFIPVLTKSFKESEWCCQECGIAFAKKQLIIPLNVDGTIPYGFIKRFQALKFRDIEKGREAIINTIFSRYENKEKLLKRLLKDFAESDCYDEAGETSEVLLKFDLAGNSELVSKQINEILKVSINNNQIYGSRSARPSLSELVYKYKNSADIELVKELKRLWKIYFP